MPKRLSNKELEYRENNIGRLVAIQKRLETLEEIARANYSPELLDLIRECYALLVRAKGEEIARLHARKDGMTEEALYRLFSNREEQKPNE